MLIPQEKLLTLLMMFKKQDKTKRELSIRQKPTVTELFQKLEVKLKKFFKKQRVIETN